MEYGPTLEISKEIHRVKYRLAGESFEESQTRFANALKDSEEHFKVVRSILLDQRFLGGGRVQAAVGAPRKVTCFNCFVSGEIEDNSDSIMQRATEAFKTMRLGGGIGYDFSSLRPSGDRIVSLDSKSSGPVSFMGIYDSICQTISSAGHRRGAQMGVLRIDHPDIETFIRAKQNDSSLKGFNISIGVTDHFMECLLNDKPFELKFEGRVYKEIDPKFLWEEVMRSTWDWAEPGVLFIDRLNDMNPLQYCETIAATNPCGEQPLPPHGACLLGSFNLVKYLITTEGAASFDRHQFVADIPPIVRAMDNIHDISIFPLEEQRAESQSKRRMGLGLTGVANTGEILGYPYGSDEFCVWLRDIMKLYRDTVYNASIDLAIEKGAFPLFNKEYLNSGFIKTLPEGTRTRIQDHGIRNSHLLSIAPTGTISLSADNVSSGIEPTFLHEYDRTIQKFDGAVVQRVKDYAWNFYGIKGKTASECTPQEHLRVLAIAQQYVDSAVSKTINVPPDLDWDAFKGIYMDAWKTGCKGVTTFNSGGKRFGILNEVKDEREACKIDPETMIKTCE